VAREGEGLEGEDFPGKFRETPRPPDPTRTFFAQNQRPPPVRGRSPTPSLPLAYAHMRVTGFLLYRYYFWGSRRAHTTLRYPIFKLFI